MSFPASETKVPTSIGTIIHTMIDSASGSDEIRYMYQVLDQDGAVMATEFGDETSHLSAAQISAIESFLAAQRGKAEATLPE